MQDISSARHWVTLTFFKVTFFFIYIEKKNPNGKQRGYIVLQDMIVNVSIFYPNLSVICTFTICN